jgi:hypothetical protein
MDTPKPIGMFDRVRILNTTETESLGFAGKLGLVYGITTPSDTRISVVAGSTAEDRAFCISFEDPKKELWLGPDVVEFVDHGSGTMAQIRKRRMIRGATGEWLELKPDPPC